MPNPSHSSDTRLSVRHTPRLGFLSTQDWKALTRVLRLSPRESAIVELAVHDLSEPLIANELGISRHTVHTHLERTYRKLSVHSRCQLALLVFQTYVTRLLRAR
jgi:DNA-binding NarL/FixJ family response regulator